MVKSRSVNETKKLQIFLIKFTQALCEGYNLDRVFLVTTSKQVGEKKLKKSVIRIKAHYYAVIQIERVSLAGLCTFMLGHPSGVRR